MRELYRPGPRQELMEWKWLGKRTCVCPFEHVSLCDSFDWMKQIAYVPVLVEMQPQALDFPALLLHFAGECPLALHLYVMGEPAPVLPF